MAEVFGNAMNIRGCFYAFTANGANRGARLLLPSGNALPGNNFSEPILVSGFSYSQQEAVAYVKVFGDYVYTYAFGHDPGPSVLTVEYIGFLVDGKNYSGVVGKVNSAYKKGRVYEAKKYAKLSLGSGSNGVLRGFILGMGSQTLDAEHSLQRFHITLGLAEVQG